MTLRRNSACGVPDVAAAAISRGRGYWSAGSARSRCRTVQVRPDSCWIAAM